MGARAINIFLVAGSVYVYVCVCACVDGHLDTKLGLCIKNTHFFSFFFTFSLTLVCLELFSMGKQRKRRNDTNIFNLATLTTSPNDDDICDSLKARYEQRQHFMWMGSRQLMILREPCTLSMNEEHQMGLDYIADYKDTSNRQQGNLLLRPPHVFELVNRAYFHMRRTGTDQVVTLW